MENKDDLILYSLTGVMRTIMALRGMHASKRDSDDHAEYEKIFAAAVDDTIERLGKLAEKISHD